MDIVLYKVSIIIICWGIIIGLLFCARQHALQTDKIQKQIDEERQYIHENLYLMWSRLQPILEKHSIQYFADGGSLLGAVRDQNIIQHDDDIDICVLAEDEHILTSAAFIDDLKASNLYIIQAADAHEIAHAKIYMTDSAHNFFIDIFVMIKDKDAYRYTLERHRNLYPLSFFYVNELLPTKNYGFGKYTIKGAHNPIPYLERYYGSDWKTPKMTHNHLKEIGLRH